MGLGEIALVVSIVLAVTVIYDLGVRGRAKKLPVTSSYRCSCGMSAEVKGYTPQETGKIVQQIREQHHCKEE